MIKNILVTLVLAAIAYLAALSVASNAAGITHIKTTKFKAKDRVVEILAVRDDLKNQSTLEIMACGTLIEVTFDRDLLKQAPGSPDTVKFDEEVNAVVVEVCQ